MLTSFQIERFKTRIAASIHCVDGCWLWIKSRYLNGYGHFSLGGGKSALAHRISYQVFVGPIPVGMHVCHHCDVRACVNPDHLFIGTRSENAMDAVRKNRFSRTHQKKGSAHPSAKLSEKDIPDILNLLRAGKSKVHISKLYGVTDRVILLIDRGEAWKHVPRA